VKRFHIDAFQSRIEAIMNSPSVLILGGNGYIGSALAAYLPTQGITVSCIDNGLRHGPNPSAPPFRTFQDLTPGELASYDGIVLLAAHSSVSACDEQPRRAFANNVASFVDLVHKLQGQKLIFASSASVYIDTYGRPVDEFEPLPQPVSFYDLHKQVIEHYARVAYAENYYALRFGTVCGPSPNMRWDQLLNSLVWSAVHRHEVEVANRALHRPILGIHDLCRAVGSLLTQSIEAGAYNLASANVAIGEVADYVARRLQVPCRDVERATRYDLQVSTVKFQQATGMTFRDSVEGLADDLVAVAKASA
jgi:UDP-glucose 4-epimerase